MFKWIIRPIFLKISPELAHRMAVSYMKRLARNSLLFALYRTFRKRKRHSLQREVFGLQFPNPLGLAAGFDKNGDCYNEMLGLGFGFVEIGSLTPRPQSGNPKPRIFVLPKDKAMINRTGLDNKGVAYAIDQLRKRPRRGIVAANIAMNATSKFDEVVKDYETAFSLIYDFVDIIVLNFSWPGVPGLQGLGDVAYISDLIDPIMELRQCYDINKPVLIKISPDYERDQLGSILDYCMMSGIDGIVAANVTESREGLTTSPEILKKIGPGEISGAPLYSKSLSLVKFINEYTGGRLPVVGVGGIMTPEQALEMLDAGASLIEINTGLAYEGPDLIKKILKKLDRQ